MTNSNNNYNITNETTIKVYRFLIYTDITLRNFAMNNHNCTLLSKSSWRCTYHAKQYSMNIFNARKVDKPALIYIVFTKKLEKEYFKDEFITLFDNCYDESTFSLINWVEKYYTNVNDVDFEELYSTLDSKCKVQKKTNGKHNKESIATYNQCGDANNDINEFNENQDALLSLNVQKFSALIIQPFPDNSNIRLEVFNSGVINVAGILSVSTFAKIDNYIKLTLFPLMKSLSDQHRAQTPIDIPNDFYI